ncbi:MAG: acyltransferase family protein [Muribaculaceae bacterium]|nr:acyltransferase family protein [Muribaculaceae bacterium]
MKNERSHNDQVSVIKGIAILGILWEHATLFLNIPVLNRIVSMPMLPLFIIVSGYCFNDYYYDHRLTFVKKRIKSLYWPFVKWGVIFVLLHNLFCYIGFYPANMGLYTWRDMLATISHILVMHTTELLAGANWFLAELFFGTMLFIAFVPWIKRYPLIGVIIFALVAVVMNLTGFHFRLRDVSLMCASYYTLGFWVRGRKLEHRLSVMVLLLALFVFGTLVVPGTFQNIIPKWIIPHYITVLAGSWLIAVIAWHIVTRGGWLSRILVYIGDRTLIILVLHFTAMQCVSWAISNSMELTNEYIIGSPIINGLIWACPIYFLAGVVLPLAVDYIGRIIEGCLKKIAYKL